MKRVLALVPLWLVFSTHLAFAALSAQTVWEVRSLGADTNGGGFVAAASGCGTDYSQQNAAQFSGTDLTVDATTNTKVTSTSHGAFASTDVCNILQIPTGVTGYTAGFYQIVSVAAGIATLDRSPAATSTSGGTYAEGGALASLNKLGAAMVAFNKAFVKADGTYSVSSQSTFATNGGQQFTNLPNMVIGYTTTRGDNGPATIQASAGSISMLSVTGIDWRFYNLNFDCNLQTTCTIATTTQIPLFYNVKFKNFTSHALLGGGIFLKSEITGGTGCTDVINTNLSNAALGFMNYVHGNACTTLVATNFGSVWALNLFANNTGSTTDALTGSSLMAFLNIVYNTGRDGIVPQSTSFFYGIQPVFDNIVVASGRYGMNMPGGAYPAFQEQDGNAFFNNVSGNRHNMNDTGTQNASTAVAPYTDQYDQVLSSDPFVNAAGGNFGLNTTSGGGLAVRGTAIPGTFLGLGTTTSYPSFGSVQPNTTNVVGGAFSSGR